MYLCALTIRVRRYLAAGVVEIDAVLSQCFVQGTNTLDVLHVGNRDAWRIESVLHVVLQSKLVLGARFGDTREVAMSSARPGFGTVSKTYLTKPRRALVARRRNSAARSRGATRCPLPRARDAHAISCQRDRIPNTSTKCRHSSMKMILGQGFSNPKETNREKKEAELATSSIPDAPSRDSSPLRMKSRERALA